MSLKTIRIIECDGREKCMNRAEVSGSTRSSRAVLKKGGWVRVRRGQSMVDLCPWCKAKAKKGRT